MQPMYQRAQAIRSTIGWCISEPSAKFTDEESKTHFNFWGASPICCNADNHKLRLMVEFLLRKAGRLGDNGAASQPPLLPGQSRSKILEPAWVPSMDYIITPSRISER